MRGVVPGSTLHRAFVRLEHFQRIRAITNAAEKMLASETFTEYEQAAHEFHEAIACFERYAR